MSEESKCRHPTEVCHVTKEVDGVYEYYSCTVCEKVTLKLKVEPRDDWENMI